MLLGFENGIHRPSADNPILLRQFFQIQLLHHLSRLLLDFISLVESLRLLSYVLKPFTILSRSSATGIAAAFQHRTGVPRRRLGTQEREAHNAFHRGDDFRQFRVEGHQFILFNENPVAGHQLIIRAMRCLGRNAVPVDE